MSELDLKLHKGADMEYVFREGDFVELIPITSRKKSHRFVVKLVRGEKISTHYGDIRHDQIIGLNPGSIVRSNIGYAFIALKPNLYSKIKNSKSFKFATQIIYPRDWGLIIAFSNIQNGSKIIELGTGSGALTLFLSNVIGPSGHIWSYDINPERLRIAERNLKELAVFQNYTLKVYEPSKGVEERDVDVVFIDIPEPWSVIKDAWYALSPSGFLIVYIPTFNQLQRVIQEVIRHGFVDLKVIEGFTREIQWKPYAIRPHLESYVFSAYLLFSRKSYFIPRKLLEELKDKPY